MSEQSKAFEAKSIESRLYEFWKSKGFFKGDPTSSKPPYCIVIPPPNVTGQLHMGHALVNTLQDILIRYNRMNGKAALWVPGTDHAGIATQTVVERHLMKTEGKRRKDYSREAFLDHVWKWKQSSEASILGQLQRLGCSCDWSRLRFTMDDGNNLAVRTMFKKLYEKGLIYRGDYLVNWDPVTQTALADDEVEYEERDHHLWYFRYPLADKTGHLVIATTRPETMLGDTAVAVSPKDERYSSMIGKMILHPITNRLIPIIADPFVDACFGTGAVKITPAHDHNDYQMAFRHQLPMINILTPEAIINENGAPFTGMTVEEARIAVVAEIKKLGLLEKVEAHKHRVGLSYRSKAVLEPYLSKQWFVRMEKFRDQMRSAVADGKTKLIPSNWESTYFHWIDNLRDWCISRQLWWGHRIPIWYNKNDPTKTICHDGNDLPAEVKENPDDWVQDPDVLDTWFSAALWPFASLGWPEKTPELKKFYPNAVLVTGHDILFFWVARMIMMGEEAMGEVPFPETFLHGLIYGKSYWRENKGGGITYVSAEERLDYDLGKPVPKDVVSKWEKMSKSKGNIIDPLELIDQYGTDAVRMALCASTTKARQIDLDRRRFEEFKNFANKVWNGARFVMMNLEGDDPLTPKHFAEGLNESALVLEDRWILSMLNRVVKDVNEHINSYSFDQAAIEAYDFFWKEFCAFYVEISKPVLFGKIGTSEQRKNKQKLLAIILSQSIRLLHPIAPFITEELFQHLQRKLGGQSANKGCDPYTVESIKALQAEACIVSTYPQPVRQTDINPEINSAFDLMERIVYAVRNIRGEMKIPPGTSTDLYILGPTNDNLLNFVKENQSIISALVRVNTIYVESVEPKLEFASTAVVDNLKLILPLPKEMIELEKGRLAKEREKLEQTLAKLQTQLSNQEFVSKAPQALIEKLKIQVDQTQNELKTILTKLN